MQFDVGVKPGFRWLPRHRTLEVMHGLFAEQTVTFTRLINASRIECERRRDPKNRPSYTAFVLKAVALALRDFPFANRRVFYRWGRQPRLVEFTSVDGAVAVEKDDLESPMMAYCEVVRDPGARSLAQITAILRRFHDPSRPTRQWRDFFFLITHAPIWLAKWILYLPTRYPGMWVRWRGGAFLVSSPAKYGVDSVITSWQWPIGVSFGFVRARPMESGKQVRLVPSFTLMMNWDRKIMAGAQAARFFDRIARNLEELPAEMTDSPPIDGIATATVLETRTKGRDHCG